MRSTCGGDSSARASAASCSTARRSRSTRSAAFCLTFVDFIVVLVLFSHFHALDGWTLQEIALLYGLSGIGIAIADMLIGHIDAIHLDIRSGQFDVVLLRPAGTLLQVMSSDLALRRLGRIAQATIVLVYALAAADIAVDTRCACCCSPSVHRLRRGRSSARRSCSAACLTFWTVGSGEVGDRVHLRRQHDDVVPAQHLRTVAATRCSRS